MTSKPQTRRSFVALTAAAALTGCADRGQFIAANPQQAGRRMHKVLYATNKVADPNLVSGVGRSNSLTYSLLDIATPQTRAVGHIAFTGADAFTLASQTPVAAHDLRAALKAAVNPQGNGKNRLMLWVHGFNNTSAEAVHRQVQIAQDIGHAGPAVCFSWPSAAHPSAYIHDRDSAIHGRRALADLMVALRAAWDGEIVVIAHSLGGFVTLEALGRLRISGNTSPVVDALMLVQPDIAPDVFEAQIADARPLPARTALVTAQDDAVLWFSAVVSRQRERVGATDTPARYQALGLRVIDLTGVEDEGLSHMVAFTSPSVLSELRKFVAS